MFRLFGVLSPELGDLSFTPRHIRVVNITIGNEKMSAENLLDWMALFEHALHSVRLEQTTPRSHPSSTLFVARSHAW